MHTHSNPDFHKTIRYKEPLTNITRHECIVFAKVINKPAIIKEHYDDWIAELGDWEDRTNLDAISTWVGRQHDILISPHKKRRIQLLQSRFGK